MKRDYNKYDLTIEHSTIFAHSTQAYVSEDEAPLDEIVREVINTIGTDLNVTIGGVTMFLAAWEDPGHWADEWREKIEDVGFAPAEDSDEDIIAEFVASLLDDARVR